MGQARFCDECLRADNGNGQWRYAENWDTSFLTKAVKNIKEFGGILHLKFCKLCLKSIHKKQRKIALKL